MTDSAAERLPVLLLKPLPGAAAQRRMQPDLSFGRHFGPPLPSARPAAVMILLFPKPTGWHLPLIVRPDTLVDHPGQVSLPGGAVDPGETSQQAALRELQEELGVDAGEVDLLRPLSPLYLYHSNFMIEPWVGVARVVPRWQPSPQEVAAIVELPLCELLRPSASAWTAQEHAGLQFGAPGFLWRGCTIWGATAMILAELAELVRGEPEVAGTAWAGPKSAAPGPGL